MAKPLMVLVIFCVFLLKEENSHHLCQQLFKVKRKKIHKFDYLDSIVQCRWKQPEPIKTSARPLKVFKSVIWHQDVRSMWRGGVFQDISQISTTTQVSTMSSLTFIKPFNTIFAAWQGAWFCRIMWPSGNTADIKRCIRSLAIFGWMAK